MAIFKRKALEEKGLNAEQIDYVMNEAGRLFAGYVPQADVQAQIDAALAAHKPEPVDVKTSPEYQALQGEIVKIKTLQGEDFAKVKAPYRDMLWDKLDHGEKHAPYKEQLTAMAEQLPDLFVPEQPDPEPQGKPTFGAQPQGSMPKGQQGPSFMDGWGFVPSKKE